MTRRSLTCFSLLLVAAAAALTGADTGRAAISGIVEITQRARAHEPLSDIVVWLQPTAAGSADSIQPGHAQLLQKDKMFQPHVLVVTVGTVVDFPNADPIFHNAFSSFEGQIFDIGLYPPGTSRSIRFRRPGIVRVFCNIHPTMSAVIVVLNTPYFTKAGTDGRYQMASVPYGTYDLRVFDERATAEPDVNMTVTVDPAQNVVSAPAIHLSELGYVRQPHKNKYGLDYPQSAGDAPTYSGLPQ
jgi:plastocyanin